MSFRYQEAGLKISSEIELPEARSFSFDGDPDLIIRRGPVPELDQPYLQGGVFQAARGLLRLELDGVARYLVEPGQILVEQAEQAEDADMRVFLLGSCLGAALYLAGRLVLHASAVRHRGRAHLFVGRSSVGKSALALGLKTHGLEPLTDELAVLRIIDGHPHLEPTFGHLKVWHDVLVRENYQPDQLQRVRSGVLHRYKVPFEPADEALPVGAIHQLGWWNQAHFDYQEIAPLERFNRLLRNTYRGVYAEGLGPSRPYFETLKRVAEVITVTSLIRPDAGIDRLRDFPDFVVEKVL
ncbi:MAG: hypothetical protein AB7S38_26150 [Vulcanimicrobiota bacterium]